MAVDGTWKLTIDTPMGAQESTLVVSCAGNTLTGTQSAGSSEGREIQDGSISGNNVSWKSSINRPMPMTLEFSATVEGDKMSGTVKLGMFGSRGFSGVRA